MGADYSKVRLLEEDAVMADQLCTILGGSSHYVRAAKGNGFQAWQALLRAKSLGIHPYCWGSGWTLRSAQVIPGEYEIADQELGGSISEQGLARGSLKNPEKISN